MFTTQHTTFTSELAAERSARLIGAANRSRLVRRSRAAARRVRHDEVEHATARLFTLSAITAPQDSPERADTRVA